MKLFWRLSDDCKTNISGYTACVCYVLRHLQICTALVQVCGCQWERQAGDAIDRQISVHRLIPMVPDTCAGHIWPETFKVGDLAQSLQMFIVYLPPLLRLPPLGPDEGAQAHGVGVLAFMEGGALLESVANQSTARHYFFFIL